MFKLITFFTASLLTVNIYSQVTLTASISPSPGDYQIQVQADTTGITQGNSGANQTWNYPNLVKVDSNVGSWMTPGSTGHGSSFPTSNIALLDTCYNYFYETNTHVDFLGNYSHNTVIAYTNPETILTYPFTYNSVMTDSFSVLINQNNQLILRNGFTTVTGDAYGTINLPFGSFSNALRLKEVITIRDSSYTYQSVVNTTFNIYEWYVPGKKFSVFKLVYTTISFLNYNFTYKNVFYNPVSPPIGIKPISTEIPKDYRLYQNYPNPFNPSTQIKFEIPNTSFVKLTVLDITGKQTARIVNEELKAGSYSVDFNAENLSSGVYFYRLEAPGFSEVKKMILIK